MDSEPLRDEVPLFPPRLSQWLGNIHEHVNHTEGLYQTSIAAMCTPPPSPTQDNTSPWVKNEV